MARPPLSPATSGLSRRAVLHASAWAMAAACLPLPSLLAQARNARSSNARIDFRMLLVEPENAQAVPFWRNIERGAALGAEEAAHTAHLLGHGFHLDALTTARLGEALSNGDDTIGALISAGGEEELHALLVTTEQWLLPVLNVGSASDGLRGPRCHERVFHLCPSETMLTTALARWHAQHGRGEGSGATGWHPDLVRFGATQLNTRYESRFPDDRMDAAAWSAWMSVKVGWEAALRSAGPGAGDIAAWLRRPSTRFDGHKGRALSFRPWDHQLRQPVYIVSSGPTPGTIGSLRGQVPESGGTARAEAVLDDLAGPPRPTTCLAGGGK